MWFFKKNKKKIFFFFFQKIHLKKNKKYYNFEIRFSFSMSWLQKQCFSPTKCDKRIRKDTIDEIRKIFHNWCLVALPKQKSDVSSYLSPNCWKPKKETYYKILIKFNITWFKQNENTKIFRKILKLKNLKKDTAQE